MTELITPGLFSTERRSTVFRHQSIYYKNWNVRPGAASLAGAKPADPADPPSALAWVLAALSRRPQLSRGSGEDILSPVRKIEPAHVTPAVCLSLSQSCAGCKVTETRAVF